MESDVRDRLQSVLAELRDGDEDVDEDEDLDARPALEPVEHLRARRRPRRVLAAMIVAALLGGAGTGGWLLLRGPEHRTPVAVLLKAGLAAQQQGERLTARALYLKALDADPHNAVALYNLGVLAQQQGDTREALARYRAASAADPKNADALFNEATILAGTDRQAAVDRYRRVIALQSDRAAAHFNLGLVLAELGSLTDARKELKAAIQLDPSLRTRVPATYAGLVPRTS